MELKNTGHVLDGTERYLEFTHVHNSWTDSSVGFIYIYIYIYIYTYIYIIYILYIYVITLRILSINFVFGTLTQRLSLTQRHSLMPSEDNTTNSNDNNSEKLEIPLAKSKK